jgi:hypothetical protein
MYISTVDMGRERTQTNIKFLFEKFGVPNTMIEIGCFEGITTFWVSEFGKIHNDKFKIYAIDPHTTLNDNPSFDFKTIKKFLSPSAFSDTAYLFKILLLVSLLTIFTLIKTLE